ncbi:MAG: ABC transporter substrate-binding protein [Vicinamibacterales bacterium]
MARAQRRLLLSLVALAAFAAASCSRPGTSGKDRPGPGGGGSLISSVRGEPRTFNRLMGRDATTDTLSVLTHARLVRVNRLTDQVEPWLAERWDTSADALTYTLFLRQGVRFSDGVPLSAADVLFSFKAAYDKATGSVLGESLLVGGKPLEVTAPDSSTVVVKFPSPFGPGIRLLDILPILPSHRLEAALESGSFARAWGVETPPSEIVGLGPFRLLEYRPGQRVVLERNPFYWRKDAAGRALPYLDRLTLEIVPDQNAELLRLQAGELDFTQGEIRPEDYGTLKKAEDAGRVRLMDLGVGLDADSLWFNLRRDKADASRPWLQARDLRHAVSHAVDRNAFADTVFLGAAVPIFGPVTPGNKTWYWPDLPTQPFDRARSRELLAGLGLADRNGDGVLEHKSGKPARFTILTQKGNTALERGASFIRESLAAVGLRADVVALEVGALVERLVSGDFDAIYFRFLLSDVDPAMALDFWLTTGGAHVWNPAQPRPATEWEREIDSLMLRQVAAVDLSERQRLFREAQRILAEELPIIYFAAPRVYVAMSSRVKNATPVLLRPVVLWSADTLAAGTASQ